MPEGGRRERGHSRYLWLPRRPFWWDLSLVLTTTNVSGGPNGSDATEIDGERGGRERGEGKGRSKANRKKRKT